MRPRKRSRRVAVWAASWCCAVAPAGAALAQTASPQGAAIPFYSGKRLTILVNYDAGGPTDIEARLLARHLGRHLPGKPSVIVQNMGGAAGMIGTRWLGEIAPKDGSVLGYLTAATQRYVAAPEKFPVDFRSYAFIAYSPSGRIHFARTDTSPGVRTPADIVKTAGLVVGGLGPDSPKDMSMRLTLDMLGVSYRYVTGYNSSAQAMLAMQRGEIGYYADSPPDYLAKVAPMVAAGQVLPVFCDPAFDGRAFTTPRQMQALGIVPFPDLYRKVKGGEPSGQLWDAYLSLLTVNGAMYRIMALPPASPQPAIDALRRAVLELNGDHEFTDDAVRSTGEAPEYVSGPTIDADVRRSLSIEPALKAFLDAYTHNAGGK